MTDCNCKMIRILVYLSLILIMKWILLHVQNERTAKTYHIFDMCTNVVNYFNFKFEINVLILPNIDTLLYDYFPTIVL